MGLLRRLHGLLQRGVDLESGRLLGRRVHHRAARVHILLQCNDDHCSPNSGTHVDNLTCANAGAYARADASTDPGTNAGAYAGTDDGHYGTDAGTHVDVQL